MPNWHPDVNGESMGTNELISFEPIDKEAVKEQIFEVRGIRVMLDSDIAVYFGVETGALNRARKRNIKRFPESFCFQLTDEEVSRCQSVISMQTEGKKGGRTYNPYVYSEQGVAMLTSVLHTDVAIQASIGIIEAFVEMSHYIRQNQQLLPYEDLKSLELRQHQLSDRMESIEKNMVTKSELSDLMKLFESGITDDEILILNGEPFKADLAYQKIYKKAKSNLIIVDDYIGTKTLQHLTHVKSGVDITIITDNKGYAALKKQEFSDFMTEYPSMKISFIKTANKCHDRYIATDYGKNTMKMYHCGASSKDAGNKITTITEINEMDNFKDMIKDLLLNPQLKLK